MNLGEGDDGGRRGEGAACAREGRVRGYRSVVSVAAAANLRLSAGDCRRKRVTWIEAPGLDLGAGALSSIVRSVIRSECLPSRSKTRSLRRPRDEGLR